MISKKSVLITGGTGSFGKSFVKGVLDRFPNIERIAIYSRDELKQFEMSQEFPMEKHPSLRFLIGDVRDRSRLKFAMEGIDVVVHAAALKQVPTAEYNPMECIKTNVLGAENVIYSALETGVKKVIALSTDKAASPINLYGATKLCSDKLFVAANNMKGRRDLSFSVVRYGNVMGSRGSVIPFFLNKRKEGSLPITHKEMTRFNITLQEGVDMVINAISNSWGGEIFVPKIPSYKITEVANAIGPNCEHKEIGIRPGEKLHEEMITQTDSFNTFDCGDYYVILPPEPVWNLEDFKKRFNAKKVPQGFKYSSDNNKEWINAEQIRNLIKENVDPSFDSLQ